MSTNKQAQQHILIILRDQEQQETTSKGFRGGADNYCAQEWGPTDTAANLKHSGTQAFQKLLIY